MDNTKQKTCQVKIHDDKPCGRPLYDGEKCICHSGEARFWMATFSGEADFESATFSRETLFPATRFKKPVSFSLCQVSKEAVVTFDGEKLQEENEEMFSAEDDFTSCTFAEPRNVKFRKVLLEKCNFLETDVTGVQFVDITRAKKPKFLKWFPRDAVADEVSGHTDYKLIEQLYRRLQANYINNYR
ncbi:MAG: hypothetical protein ACE5K8_10220 [Candidatus Zixiibacteriota bacterium]